MADLPQPVETIRLDVQMVLEIIGHEAIIRQAYRDSEGVLTWSIGMTNATGHKVERYIGKPASLFQCISIGIWALEAYADKVRKAFAGRKLTRAQFTAALSFHWNTGAILSATWVKLWLRGADPEKVKASFLEWNKPASIKPRRAKEAALFCDGVWSNDGKTTEYERVNAKTLAPIWSSAKRIDISEEVKRAIGAQMGVHPDHPAQPDAPVVVPTLSPEGETHAKGGPNKIVIAALTALALMVIAAFFGITTGR